MSPVLRVVLAAVRCFEVLDYLTVDRTLSRGLAHLGAKASKQRHLVKEY